MGFKKFDQEKSRVDLLDPEFLLEMGRVMGHGGKKYGDDNWKKCDNPNRYMAALLRHALEALQNGGDATDEESEMATLAHAACSAMMAWRIAGGVE